jgi:hypothetical protein
MKTRTWDEFKRTFADTFYGCVAPDGLWFDSAVYFNIAVHWCACNAGEFDLSPKQEMEWMNTEGRALGYSIIHSTMLKQMYEKGLIK